MSRPVCHCCIRQVDAEVLVSFGICTVVVCGEQDQTFSVQESSQRLQACDDQVEADVELSSLQQQGVGDVALCNVLVLAVLREVTGACDHVNAQGSFACGQLHYPGRAVGLEDPLQVTEFTTEI